MLTAASTATSALAASDRPEAKRNVEAGVATLAGGWAGGLFRGIGQASRDQAQRDVLLAVALLPFRIIVRPPHLDRGHLVFRAVGRPVGIVGGDDVGAGRGVV